MPTESIPKLYEFLNDELNKLRAANQTPELRKKITKVLGKSHFSDYITLNDYNSE